MNYGINLSTLASAKLLMATTLLLNCEKTLAQLPTFHLKNVISFTDPKDAGARIIRIDGILENSQTCRPVEFATVTIKDPSHQLDEYAITDSNGVFSFFLLPEEYNGTGLLSLRAEYLGIETLDLINVGVQEKPYVPQRVDRVQYMACGGGCIRGERQREREEASDYQRSPIKDLTEYTRVISNSP